MELTICIDGVEKQLDVEKKGDHYRFSIDGKEYRVSSGSLSNGALTFFIGNRSCVAYFSEGSGGRRMAMGGRTYSIESGENENHRGGTGASAHADGTVESPMPGNIIAVNVSEGDAVRANQAVVVIESMKMQNEIAAPVDGEIKKVNCAVGDQVNFGDVLVEIEPEK
ncbi:MAG: biotin/lipoyl-binding protein [Candidatus Latescibacteria bacterium]|nr:biotin/lipoyl-binding protein [Candidatus Latescibacterota bacterium]NIM21755.1 biotin/lipoyl-binding protein [Candidatus Latescibacterota bacterium]NIM65893.1 biotin/lipoyl-binding protein [Candidatus Latescibacterota bacterium]NIO02638.1 biotin/lipoyl-binding protein [Candidatus Latescibacterota bacterium]NIO29619.1 biotin/lipoyl-binding protein [Candidatus Latescibacterota bacterium]